MDSETGNKSSPSISMHEFLDFLKISCQLQESIDQRNHDKTGGAQIDYNNLAKNSLANTLMCAKSTPSPRVDSGDNNSNIIAANVSSDSSHRHGRSTSGHHQKTHNTSSGGLSVLLYEKLNEVIGEGILDSILPFICAATHQDNRSVNNCGSSKAKISQIPINKDTTAERSITPRQSATQDPRKTPDGNVLLPLHRDRNGRRRSSHSIGIASDREVTIHVCDEVKGASRDFTCLQKLLVSKMGYFADVTAGQRLEDIDISVHCDLQIFEWLMRWVKKDSLAEEMWPLLDSTNVIPILVSAGFLQMEPLLIDCLAYCHANLNEIVKASANLSCLNDSIISRLAAMYTNLELEMVKDKKERVTPRLWTKMIQSLCEPETQALRGHYASLSDLFRCSRCHKYVNEYIASYIHCEPACMHLNRYGQVLSQHVRDLSWNFNHYISNLYKDLKSWRKVYWRLWGNCHYLYCATCETHFPLYQMNWCLFHPDQPQYLGPVTEGRMAGPAGRYPCCGQQAFRFETLPGPMGCQYREHTIQIFNDRDRQILKLAQIASESSALYEIAPNCPATPGAASSNESWWNGIALMPTKERPGLLPTINLDGKSILCSEEIGNATMKILEDLYRGGKKLFNRATSSMDSSSETDSSDNYRTNRLLKQFSTTSSDGCESDSSSPRPMKLRSRQPKCRKPKPSGRYWSGEMSARSNQDNQREYEERAMKQIISMVNKRTGNDSNGRHSFSQPIGGSFVRLEAEWREKHRQNKIKPNGNKF